ncbi:MAG TPA: polysaccharide deacetylase family protein [Anaerolineales bacterium]|nr:ChbG/HpnK family deacetylase [Anaerolineae bacterium]MBL1171728.1 ChbG/HpnK family deacetylase [Chloroflexota bacterium]MDL1926737.1 ChbG/HpnK family deacetylase [Anaerolineae bacterium AMX1]WKZ53618.1 MAG: polysaccharide deacetylase family protein [Anaerolineales bacterium]NOG75197.1 ChbG/HpnK family deacetylase [Chloroflexota bacterium]
MTPNPLLKKLGYSDADRLVIIHTDDIGMCQASIQAYKDLWEFGTITSGAAMVPCPWFPAAAEMCRENPAMDMGVHATLNAEWDGYRWGPVSTRDRDSGLMDEAGYFHQWNEAVTANAKPEAVAVEVNAQVERALAAGIDVTHVDSHMGTIIHPNFVQSYLQAGMMRLLPNMLPRVTARGFDMMGIDESALAMYAPILNQLEAQGVPMLDGLFSMPLEHDNDHVGAAKKLLSEVPAGITHLILHPSIDTPELRAICPDWRARVANYHAFMSAELKDFIKDSGIHLIGYRAIRDAMRAG